MRVVGLMNMQYAIENGKVYVLEANPRASRTVYRWYPRSATSVWCRWQPISLPAELTGRPSPVPGLKEKKFRILRCEGSGIPVQYVPGGRPDLGPEMRSTGEVLGLSHSYGEAFYKAQEATQNKLPLEGTVLISVQPQG